MVFSIALCLFYETLFSRRQTSEVNGVPSESVLRLESSSTFYNRAMALSECDKRLDPPNINNGDFDLVFSRSGIFIISETTKIFLIFIFIHFEM